MIGNNTKQSQCVLDKKQFKMYFINYQLGFCLTLYEGHTQ